ncbi:MAG: outer membrane beta-barrel protein [Longimicrobiales bacterium]
MTIRRLTLVAVVVFAATLTQPVQAQRHFVRIGFGGGVSVPTSNTADALKNGINGQAFLLLDPGIGFPFRFNLGYQKFDFKEAILGTAVTGESQILSGVAGLTLNLFSLGPLRPYITAGVGAFSLKETTGEVSESNMRFGIDGGGGLALKLGRLEAFVEGRVQNVYTEAGVIDTKTIRAIPVTFGILF